MNEDTDRCANRGARVLITRSPAKAEPFICLLTGMVPGVKVDCAPLRQAVSLPPSTGVLRALNRKTYDWVTLTSANGVAALTAWAQWEGGELSGLLTGIRVACVGTATAAALKTAGVEADFIPRIQDAAHMVAEWPVSTPQSILCIQGANARATLAEGLKALGHRVTVETVYTMKAYPVDQLRHSAPRTAGQTLSRQEAHQRIGSYTAVVATAPSLLAELFTGQNPDSVSQHLPVSAALKLPVVLAIGASTAAKARELGLEYRVSASPAPLDLATAAHTILATESAGTPGLTSM